MNTPSGSRKVDPGRWKKPLAGTLLFVVGIVLMLVLTGAFEQKVSSRTTPRPARLAAEGVEWTEVRQATMPRIETAVGSIRAVHEVSVASKLLAKVVEVRVRAGQFVAEGEVLFRLDDTDLRARRDQAAATVAQTLALKDQAEVDRARTRALFDDRSASTIELQRSETALKSAAAELQRAMDAAREAETILAYATMVSPISGQVIEKHVEVGDTVTPGQTVAKLFDPSRMQLVASVRESLSRRLSLDQTLEVRVDAIGKTCSGRVTEIVPEAQANSRSFTVKVSGPCPPGLYSGMFGRLLIPLEDETVLLVPQAAVRTIGQVHLVEVREGESLSRRAVRLGRTFDDEVEVLSGLRAGEKIALQPEDTTPRVR